MSCASLSQSALKRGLHWAGSALALAGVAFVALRLRDYGVQINFARFDAVTWALVFVLVLIYGLANLMLALAWWNLLGQFGASTSRRWALKAYGVSQLAKYVPGNIFHLAGRHAIGIAAGVPGWPLAKSAVWELGLISVAGGMFGLLALPLLFSAVPVFIGLSGFVMVVTIIAILLWRYVGHPIACALGLYLGFLAVSGLLFFCLIYLVTKGPVTEVVPWVPLCGAYVVAWLAGLVTPGAPAGVGVRELVLLFLLKGFVGEAELVLAVVLGRVVTVGGDLGFFTFSWLLNSEKEIHARI